MRETIQASLTAAAIVCEHVAASGAVIRCAYRELPEELADSGWQFLCGSVDEDLNGAQVWSVREVLKVSPELAGFIDLPPGSKLNRAGLSDSWSVGSLHVPEGRDIESGTG